MKFVCRRCLKLISDDKVIRMPFVLEINYWCKDCYDKWVDKNPYRRKQK